MLLQKKSKYFAKELKFLFLKPPKTNLCRPTPSEIVQEIENVSPVALVLCTADLQMRKLPLYVVMLRTS